MIGTIFAIKTLINLDHSFIIRMFKNDFFLKFNLTTSFKSTSHIKVESND